MLPATLHLLYPRRTRRRLLLPPGLLALAWLLWLGCVAVPQLRGGARMHLVALLIPGPLKLGWHTNLLRHRDDEIPRGLSIDHQVQVVPSSTWFRYFFEQQLHFSLPQNTRGATWQGVAFHFDGAAIPAHGAASLLASLERQSNILYWFANAPAGGTAYAFRVPPPGPVERVGMRAFRYDNVRCIPPTPVPWTDQLWTKQVKPFLAPDWRNSLLLLLLIGGLSAIRMGRR